jgi:dCMP deaminase
MSDTGETKYVRPSWDEYFMEVMDGISKRATCGRGRSGCVIAKDNMILVTVKKTIHEDGSVTEHCVRTVHAEQNAICQAAKRGVALDGATLYCRMTPCRVCAMLIINCGIKKVVCQRKYHAGGESEEMFKTAGVKLEFFHEEVQQYETQKK